MEQWNTQHALFVIETLCWLGFNVAHHRKVASQNTISLRVDNLKSARSASRKRPNTREYSDSISPHRSTPSRCPARVRLLCARYSASGFTFSFSQDDGCARINVTGKTGNCLN